MINRVISRRSYRLSAAILIFISLSALSLNTNAACSGVMGRILTGYDYHTASLGVGRINIISNYLQPVGGVLAVGMSNYSTIRSGGLANLGEEDIILTCTSQSDKAALGWGFATNGDSRIGGFYEIPGFPGYYATQFPYVAIKLTFADTGEVFSRYWQRSSMPVQTENTANGGFVVKKKHLPKVVATLIKWPSHYGQLVDANGNGVSNTFCSGLKETMIPVAQTSNPNQVWSADFFAVNGLDRGCGQPNGYINLLGTGGYVVEIGKDSNLNYWAWDYSIPIGLNGSPAATFSYTPSCVVRTATAYVSFPTVTVEQLKAGQSVSKNFDVNLECDNTISTAINTSSVAVGLQPSLSAFNHAKRLGLIDSATGGITHLLSDDYGAGGMATGVGIRLKNGDGNPLNFVSWEGCIPVVSGYSSYCPNYGNLAQLRAAGWDPVMSASTKVSSNTATATTVYRKTYTATLGRINNLEPTAGKIKATATVLVRLP
jgi:type 1 fimbria pilin